MRAYLNKRREGSGHHGEAVLRAEDGVSPLERVREPDPAHGRSNTRHMSVSEPLQGATKLGSKGSESEAIPGRGVDEAGAVGAAAELRHGVPLVVCAGRRQYLGEDPHDDHRHQHRAPAEHEAPFGKVMGRVLQGQKKRQEVRK